VDLMRSSRASTRNGVFKKELRCLLASIAFACLFASASAVAAQAGDEGAGSFPWQLGPARAISLQEAVAYAQTHQPSLRAALDRVKVAEADAQVPRASWLPRSALVAEALEGTANNTTASFVAAQDMALPRIGATRTVDSGTWAPSPSTLAAISIGQELFDFGRIASQSAAADAAVVSERHRAEAERLAIGNVELLKRIAQKREAAAERVVPRVEEGQHAAAAVREFRAAVPRLSSAAALQSDGAAEFADALTKLANVVEKAMQ